MLEQWNNQDPISDWEIERNKRICKAQGSGNNLMNVSNTFCLINGKFLAT